MTQRRLLPVCALILSTASSAEADPSAVDADLFTVVSTAHYRFLEYRVCSPEHCWSKAYLQWLDGDGSTKEVIHSIELEEIGYGSAVDAAHWVWVDTQAELRIRIVPSHGGFEPYELLIIPGEAGKYLARRHRVP